MSYDEKYEAEVMNSGRIALEEAVVGHRIVSVVKERYSYDYGYGDAIKLTLDTGKSVYIADTADCCAFTETEGYKWLESVDNAVTSVRAENGFIRWFIYAGEVPVVSLNVAWSPGNPYYYGFGFEIKVEEKEN